MDLTQSLEVTAPVEAVYDFWRAYEAFPEVLKEVKSVKKLDEKKSEWVVQGPMDASIQFQSELTQDNANQSIAWISRAGDIPHQGQVQFTPTADGERTQIRLKLEFEPPGGDLGNRIAGLGEMLARNYVGGLLYRIKTYLEGPQPESA